MNTSVNESKSIAEEFIDYAKSISLDKLFIKAAKPTNKEKTNALIVFSYEKNQAESAESADNLDELLFKNLDNIIKSLRKKFWLTPHITSYYAIKKISFVVNFTIINYNLRVLGKKPDKEYLDILRAAYELCQEVVPGEKYFCLFGKLQRRFDFPEARAYIKKESQLKSVKDLRKYLQYWIPTVEQYFVLLDPFFSNRDKLLEEYLKRTCICHKGGACKAHDKYDGKTLLEMFMEKKHEKTYQNHQWFVDYRNVLGFNLEEDYFKMLNSAEELKQEREVVLGEKYYFENLNPKLISFFHQIKKGSELKLLKGKESKYIWIPTIEQYRSLLSPYLKSENEIFSEYYQLDVKGSINSIDSIDKPFRNYSGHIFLKMFMRYKYNKEYEYDTKWTQTLSFKINDYILLKLQAGRTNIYVNNSVFNQCKYLLLNLERKTLSEYDNADSIDEVKQIYDNRLEVEGRKLEKGSTPSPEEEFWGHCSNIQVWAENNYDTRILHSNLSFPLLKRLTEVGDPLARKVLKDEVIKRVLSNYQPVVEYLVSGGYLQEFTSEELLTIISDIKDLVCRITFLGELLKRNSPIPHLELLKELKDEITSLLINNTNRRNVMDFLIQNHYLDHFTFDEFSVISDKVIATNIKNIFCKIFFNNMLNNLKKGKRNPQYRNNPTILHTNKTNLFLRFRGEFLLVKRELESETYATFSTSNYKDLQHKYAYKIGHLKEIESDSNAYYYIPEHKLLLSKQLFETICKLVSYSMELNKEAIIFEVDDDGSNYPVLILNLSYATKPKNIFYVLCKTFTLNLHYHVNTIPLLSLFPLEQDKIVLQKLSSSSKKNIKISSNSRLDKWLNPKTEVDSE